jgi:hypothetical protein
LFTRARGAHRQGASKQLAPHLCAAKLSPRRLHEIDAVNSHSQIKQ